MKCTLFLITLLLCFNISAATVKNHYLLTDATATGAGTAVQPLGVRRTYQAIGNTTAGAGASTIDIEVSNDGTNYVVVDTLSLTLATTVSSDSFESDKAWKYVRGNVKTISGTGAKVSLILGADYDK